MITVRPFTMSVLDKAKQFFALRTIASDSLEIVRRTPAGDDSFTEADVWRMDNGQLVVSLNHPFSHLSNLVLIAKSDGVEEIINLEHFERIIEFYDRSPDVNTSEVGVFFFCPSEPIYDPALEWRCDNTLYGARSYNAPLIIGSLDDIITYEPVLTVPAVGHLIYLHLRNDEIMRRDFVDNAELPISGYTLSEMFKVLHEWATVADAPFNNADPISSDARGFLDAIGFDESLIEGQVDMQVASYLRGKPDARLRPTGVLPTSPELLHFVRQRMAFSSLSALSLVYPDLVDTAQVLKEEQRQLYIGIHKFREFYKVGLEIPINDEERVIEQALKIEGVLEGVNRGYVHNQLRMFRNKREVLDRVANGYL